VRPDQHVVAQPRRRPTATAHERVLHHHGPIANVDSSVLGSQDGTEKDPSAGADVDITAKDRVRCDVGRRVDDGLGTSVVDQHAAWLPVRLPLSTPGASQRCGPWAAQTHGMEQQASQGCAWSSRPYRPWPNGPIAPVLVADRPVRSSVGARQARSLGDDLRIGKQH